MTNFLKNQVFRSLLCPSGHGGYLERINTYKRDAYQLINAKIGYEAENWDIYLYGKNIFDEDYSKVDATYIYYSDPREIGVKLTRRF